MLVVTTLYGVSKPPSLTFNETTLKTPPTQAFEGFAQDGLERGKAVSRSHHPKRARFGTLSSTFTHEIAKNQVLSRLVMEILGYDPWIIALARNKYERYEKLFDTFCRLTIATAAPVFLERALNPILNRRITEKFKLPKGLNPLKMPLELLDKTHFNPNAFVKALPEYTQKGLPPIKLTPQQIRRLVPMASNIAGLTLFYKLAIVAIDLMLMASKGQLSFWGKNALTERLSGKKGFSGELSIASEALLAKKTEAHEKYKSLKRKLSLAIGYGSTLVLPFIMHRALTMSKATAKTPLGKVKGLIPFFNYHNAVYMSKWVVLWHHVFNNISPGLWAARDGDERREHLVKSATYSFFFSAGDDLVTGQYARLLQKANKKKLEGLKLVHKKGPFGFPSALHFHEVYTLTPKTAAQKLANHLAQKTFWFGLLTTAMILGVVTTLLNNWYTMQKVLQEQAQEDKKAYDQLSQKHQFSLKNQISLSHRFHRPSYPLTKPSTVKTTRPLATLHTQPLTTTFTPASLPFPIGYPRFLLFQSHQKPALQSLDPPQKINL